VVNFHSSVSGLSAWTAAPFIVPHRRPGRVAAVRSLVRFLQRSSETRTRDDGSNWNPDPVTSETVLNGWRAVLAGASPKRGALALGCIAVVSMGIVACTTVIGGKAGPDTTAAPAYRSSVSLSVSASSATSKIRESQRQASLTTQAIRNSCNGFATTSKTAIDRSNEYVAALNQGRNTGPTEGPAIDALNNSANTVSGGLSDALSQELRDAMNAYADAARAVANAIATHAGTSEFNRRVDLLNATRRNVVKLCQGSM
jgi:hypothetical protein